MENTTNIQFIDNSVIIIIFISIFILGIVISIITKRAYSDFKIKRKYKSGERGEITAAKLLKKSGYNIIKAQPKGKAYVWIDGKMNTLNIRADYLIEKNGIKYICEVKTGNVAGDILFKHTRRQLLEYYLYFQLPIIFVDVKNKAINLVEFAFPE